MGSNQGQLEKRGDWKEALMAWVEGKNRVWKNEEAGGKIEKLSGILRFSYKVVSQVNKGMKGFLLVI